MKISTDSTPSGVSRRSFMGTCGKMSTIPVLSSILQLKMTNAAIAASRYPITDYKALVCILLDGGNDSFNTLIPYASGNYAHVNQQYKDIRGKAALNSSLPILSAGQNGDDPRWFGIHSSMPFVKNQFESGSLTFVANIGTLADALPDGISSGTELFTNPSYKSVLPRGLFSHLEQKQAWQTSVPDQLGVGGWIGRMSDIINDSANDTNAAVSMNISIGGGSLLLDGPIGQFTIGEKGPKKNNLTKDPMAKSALADTLDETYSNVLKQHYNHVRKKTIDQNEFYVEKYDQLSGNSALGAFPDTKLGRQLHQVAKAIELRNELGAKRQTFFIRLNGFDHHFNLFGPHAALMKELNDGLEAFQRALEVMEVSEKVVTYTASDFGRTLTPNGVGDDKGNFGTDHGWGGNCIVMSGALKPNMTVYGEYPDDLTAGSKTDAGRGRIVPTTSVDELHADLALWYGVRPMDLPVILPNLGRFGDDRGLGRKLEMFKDETYWG